jgi:deazaflavin-dependent oxidoreductase (nitroreductase family)
MRVEPLTRAWARWFSTMDVTFYRMFGNLSPLNWNKLVLTTRGRQTGREISTPLLFLEREGKLYVVASFGGSDTAPAWYLNLVANRRCKWSAGGHVPRIAPVPCLPRKRKPSGQAWSGCIRCTRTTSGGRPATFPWSSSRGSDLAGSPHGKPE